MNREIEVRILDIHIGSWIKKLKAVGARFVEDKILNRILFDYPDNSLNMNNKLLRLRTNGKKTTLAFKIRYNHEVDGREEHEVEIDDYNKAALLFEKVGFQRRKVMESRRISFQLDGSEIEIDFWPLIPPHIEIESKTKKQLTKTLKKLEVKPCERIVIGGAELYKRYGVDIDNIKDLKLEKEKKEMKIG